LWVKFQCVRAGGYIYLVYTNRENASTVI